MFKTLLNIQQETMALKAKGTYARDRYCTISSASGSFWGSEK